MDATAQSVESHYGRGAILASILEALLRSGKDLSRLTPADLAPVDEFHIRGRESTIELAGRMALEPGLRVLDVGCGLGGSARYLASEHGCRVTGIDLTHEYVEAATALVQRVGLAGEVEFRQGSALAMPFESATFDLAWTEHAQMNIADKRTFYSEVARVLKPGGRFAFHDILQGKGGAVHFPVPWADEPSISFLATPEVARETMERVGFRILQWEDRTARAMQWLAEAMEKVKQSGPQPLGIQLLMGATAKAKLANMLRNLDEARVVTCQAIAEKA